MPRLFINLTPCIPLSFEGEGEDVLERGLRPLSYLHPPSPVLNTGEGGQGDGLLNNLMTTLEQDIFFPFPYIWRVQ